MNKNCYRLVFNKVRGMLIAVAEAAVSRSKSSGVYTVSHNTMNITLPKRGTNGQVDAMLRPWPPAL